MSDTFRPFTIPSRHPVRKELQGAWELYLAIGKEGIETSQDKFTHIFLSLYFRSCRLYRSALSLVADGFGPEAESMTRGMYEATLVSYWAMSNRAETVDRFDLHAYYAVHLNVTQQGERDGSSANEEELLTPDELARAIKLFGRYGHLPWHGQSIVDLDRAFTEKLRSDGIKTVDNYFTGTHRWLNWNVHGSPLNLFRISEIEEDRRVFYVVPGEVDLADAVKNATNQLLLALGTRFLFTGGGPSEDLQQQIFEVWRTQNPVAYSTTRNEPCPCGSGRKYKQCHLL